MERTILLISFLFIFIHNTNSQIWEQQNSGTTNQLNSVSASKLPYVWACGNNGTIIKTTNSGENWINVSGNGVPSSLNLLNIFSDKIYNYYPSELNYAYVTGTDSAGSYIYMTSNGGSNWHKVLTVTGTGARINGIWFLDTLNGFAEGEPVAGRWSFWNTTDKGLTWDSSGLYLDGQSYTGFPNNVSGKITHFDESKLYIGVNYNTTESRILRSTNFGLNWTVLSTGINKSMTSISFIRGYGYPYGFSEVGFIGGDNYIYQTTNSGNNWSLFANLPFTPNLVGFISDMISFYGFYLKTDSNNLQIIYEGFLTYNWYPSLIVFRGMKHMQGMDNKMWVVGDSGKIYDREIVYPFVNKIGNEIPETFNLEQNYPNPFNSSTIIRYDLKKSSNVLVKIYDAAGRLVTTLVNEKQTAGKYEIRFDAGTLPSGIYFYQLQTEDFSQTKKMVLIK